MSTQRYQHLKSRVPAAKGAYHGSMQHNGSKREKEAEEMLRKLEEWKELGKTTKNAYKLV